MGPSHRYIGRCKDAYFVAKAQFSIKILLTPDTQAGKGIAMGYKKDSFSKNTWNKKTFLNYSIEFATGKLYF